MSEENVELVRRATEAWNTGGIEALLLFYPEDVVWWPFPEFMAGSAGLHGHDGIREIMAGWDEASRTTRSRSTRSAISGTRS